MQIFSGSSNPELASKISQLLNVQLGSIKISQFSGDEKRVWVKDKKIEKDVVVVQSLSRPTNDNLIEFCLICDALRRGGATEITAVIPWMGYSKQDKVFREGEPLSAKVIAQIIQVAHVSKIITFDLHNKATLGFFDVPVIDLTAKPLFIEYFKKSISDNTVVVAPDAGAVKSSTAFASELGVPVVYMDKKRDLVSGEVTVVGMSRSVEGVDVIIIDDNVFTGSTLIESANALKKSGAKSIKVGVTHHLFVPGVQEKLEESEIDEIIVTDTIVNNEPKKYRKLKILSVAQMVVDELR